LTLFTTYRWLSYPYTCLHKLKSLHSLRYRIGTAAFQTPIPKPSSSPRLRFGSVLHLLLSSILTVLLGFLLGPKTRVRSHYALENCKHYVRSARAPPRVGDDTCLTGTLIDPAIITAPRALTCFLSSASSCGPSAMSVQGLLESPEHFKASLRVRHSSSWVAQAYERLFTLSFSRAMNAHLDLIDDFYRWVPIVPSAPRISHSLFVYSSFSGDLCAWTPWLYGARPSRGTLHSPGMR
jgi:hypothetical protein